MKKILCMSALAVSFVAGLDSASAQKFNRADFVSNSELKRSGGMRIKIPRFGTYKIVSARIDAQSTKDCLVHIPSVREQLLRIAKGGDAKGKQIKIKLMSTWVNGELACYSSGTDCTVIVQVPTPTSD